MGLLRAVPLLACIHITYCARVQNFVVNSALLQSNASSACSPADHHHCSTRGGVCQKVITTRTGYVGGNRDIVCGCAGVGTCVQEVTVQVQNRTAVVPIFGCPHSNHISSSVKAFRLRKCSSCKCYNQAQVAASCSRKTGTACGGRIISKSCPSNAGEVECVQDECLCKEGFCSSSHNDGRCYPAQIAPFKMGEKLESCLKTKPMRARLVKAGLLYVTVIGAPFAMREMGALAADRALKVAGKLFEEKVCSVMDKYTQLADLGKQLQTRTLWWCAHPSNMQFCFKFISGISSVIISSGASLPAFASMVMSNTDKLLEWVQKVAGEAILSSARRGFGFVRKNIDYALSRLLGIQLYHFNRLSAKDMFNIAICRAPKLVGWATSDTMKKIEESVEQSVEQGKAYGKKTFGQIDDFAKDMDNQWDDVAGSAENELRTNGIDVAEHRKLELAEKWKRLLDEGLPQLKKLFDLAKKFISPIWERAKEYIEFCEGINAEVDLMNQDQHPRWDTTQCDCFWCTRSDDTSCSSVRFRMSMPTKLPSKLGGMSMSMAGEAVTEGDVCSSLAASNWKTIASTVAGQGNFDSPLRMENIDIENAAATLDVSIDPGTTEKDQQRFLKAIDERLVPRRSRRKPTLQSGAVEEQVAPAWQALLSNASMAPDGPANRRLWQLFRTGIGTADVQKPRFKGHEGYCRQVRVIPFGFSGHYKGCRMDDDTSVCRMKPCKGGRRLGCHLG